MDFDTPLVSDDQLLALSRNEKLDRDIRALATRELERRDLSQEQFEALQKRYDSFAAETAPRRLSRPEAAFIILFPFLGGWLRLFWRWNGREVTLRGYYWYATLGYALWSLALILILVSSRR